MIGKEEEDKLVAEQIVVECRRIRGPVLIHKTGAHRAQRIVTYGFPVEAWITKKWRIAGKQGNNRSSGQSSLIDRRV